MKKVIHTLVTKAGEKYTGRILRTQTEDAHRMNRDMPQDFLLYLVEVQGKKLWLNNHIMKLKCGRNATFFWELDETGEHKIKKALGESAKKKT